MLALAEDERVPLLERAKFLAIFSQNLDEFFQVRVAGLKEQVSAGLGTTTPDGRTPGQQLLEVRDRVERLVRRQQRLFLDGIVPALAANGIRLSSWDELDDDDEKFMVETFEQRIFPVLTPLAVDPGHPFPYISNLSLNLAILLRDPVTEERRFARVKVPDLLPRFVVMPDGERFVPLEQVIAAHLGQLFPGMEVESNHTFRVSRNADLTLEEEEADDLLAAVEIELRRRQFGRAVRLELSAGITDEVRELLQRELDLGEDDIYRCEGPLDLGGLWSVHALDRPELKDPVFKRVSPARLDTGEEERPDFFAVLREGDVLVHHPYDSFRTTVEEFIRQASIDPHVLAIKMTLYRTSGDSPIVRSLIRAAERGKQVAVLVELKARFDEGANIEWAKALETAGVHVVYGLVGLKVHTKTALVVRDEPDGIRRYCHIGTGNYNSKTARIYEDIGLLTCDADVGADLTQLFNFLTGYGRDVRYQTLLVSPHTTRTGIERADPQRGEGRPGGRAGVDHPEDEQPRRHRDDRCPVRGVAGRGRDRPDHPGHLLPHPRHPGRVGADPGAVDRRPLPRAQPDLPLRERRRRRPAPDPDRVGRPDAAQPRPAGRGPGAGRRAGAAGPPRRDPRGEPGRRHARLAAAHRRRLDPRRRLGRGGDAPAPAGDRPHEGPPAQLTLRRAPNVGARFTSRSPSPCLRAPPGLPTVRGDEPSPGRHLLLPQGGHPVFKKMPMLWLSLLLAFGLVAAACGSDDESSSDHR